MWYVIQTRSGEEHDLCDRLKKLLESSAYERMFIPLYEEVRRSYGKISLSFRNLFPGYVFVDTEAPQLFREAFRFVHYFARVLGAEEEDKTRSFIPVETEDAAFLETLFDDGIMHVSYIRMKDNRLIEKVVGPLAKYRNHITKLDIPHRRAIVEADMFGKRRRIKFGLWLEGDPVIPWLQDRMELPQEKTTDAVKGVDIGIHPGDRVVDESGLYGDYVFTVESVNAKKRTLVTWMELWGQHIRIVLRADQVRVL